MKRRRIRFEREREYAMSVAEAWRLLADTDHLNRSIGLPAIIFSAPDTANGSFLRRARARAFGVIPVRWKEYPFEWIRERRYVVRREFEWGPIAALDGGVELAAVANGVRVKVYADFTPANVIGLVLWRLGAGTVTDMLEFCDRYLSRKAEGKIDAVPVPREAPRVDRARVDRLIERLARKPVQSELLPTLRQRILEGSEDQLVSLRAYAVADAWGADRAEVLRLFLYAAKTGLFELRWDLMCPNCRVAKAEASSLSQLPRKYHCETCGIDYETDLDQRVELRFSVHPGVREVELAVHCIGGPLRMPHVVAQQYLRPNEGRQLDVTLDATLRLRAIGGSDPVTLRPEPSARRPSEVSFIYANGRWAGPHSGTEGKGEYRVPAGASLQLRNQTGGPLLAVVEDASWANAATTAAEVTALQEFRDLFSSEVLAPDQQLAVQEMALIFSDLKGSTSLYEDVGDASAYSRVNRHFAFIREQIAQKRGTTVKTIGDGVMAAFFRLEDALDAALSIQRNIRAWSASQGIDPPLVLKVGVHHGPVIAMNANGTLDYFGRTVNLAARAGDQSLGGDVVLLEQVFEDASGSAVKGLTDLTTERFTARLRGCPGEQRLVRIKIDSPAGNGSNSLPDRAREVERSPR